MISPGPDTILSRRPGLVVEGFDDAVLIWDESSARLHHLDLWAAVVWEELDGFRPLSALSRDLADEFSASRERLADDLLTVAGKLLKECLVVAVADGQWPRVDPGKPVT